MVKNCLMRINLLDLERFHDHARGKVEIFIGDDETVVCDFATSHCDDEHILQAASEAVSDEWMMIDSWNKIYMGSNSFFTIDKKK